MIQTYPLLILPGDCEVVAGHLIQQLAYSGIRAERSFDLQRARAVHTNCTCPHHVTVKCNCQMIVLLVYFPNSVLHTLIAHGCDGITHLNWNEELSQNDEIALRAIIREVGVEIQRSKKTKIPTGI